MKNKKVLVIGSITLVVLILLAFIGKQKGLIGQGYITKVTAEKPEKRTIVELITANGKLQPETEVKLSPDVPGEIVDLNVIEGQEVMQGDLLLKIKPDTYISNLDRVEAGLNQTKSNFINSKARLSQIKAQFVQTEQNYQRNKKLAAQGAISQADWEASQSQYEVGKAQVEAAEQDVSTSSFAVKSAEASLKEAKENLIKTSIYAPMSGTISKLSVKKGERVVGTAQFSGTELLRIANLNKMEVLVNVNENDIVRVKLGDTAIIEVDAYLNKKFRGTVREIANSATSSSSVSSDQVTNFEVKISILPESYKDLIPKNSTIFYPFRPGMSATVDIQTKTKYGVLTIPIQSVTTRVDSSGVFKEKTTEQEVGGDQHTVNKGNKETTSKKEIPPKEVVFVFKNGMVYMKEVTTGIQDNNYIEISGIDEKDEVVTAPYSAISKKLKDKQKVEKVAKDKLFEGKE